MARTMKSSVICSQYKKKTEKQIPYIHSRTLTDSVFFPINFHTKHLNCLNVQGDIHT